MFRRVEYRSDSATYLVSIQTAINSQIDIHAHIVSSAVTGDLGGNPIVIRLGS